MSHLDSTIGNPGEAKRSAVVLLRWVLVIATASLILFGHPQNDPLPGRIAVLLLIFSNLLLASLPARYFASGRFDSALVVLDVIVVSASLWVSGSTGSDFYLLYFVMIMIAALGETLRSIIVSALLVSTVYIGLKTSASGYETLIHTDVLMRIPFFFIVAIFYGYFAQLVKSERSVRVVYENKFTLAHRLRELGNAIGSSLERKEILERLVRSQVEFTGSEYSAVISRGSRGILADHGLMVMKPLPEKVISICTSLERRIALRERGRDNIDSQLGDSVNTTLGGPNECGSAVYFREGEFTCVPVSTGVEADLYLILHGHISGETLEYVSVLMISAAMALNNAAQFKALIHEVEKRQELNRQLTEAIEFKSQFVANISHEIRTPLHSFIGFGELLLNGGYGIIVNEQRDVILRMVKNANGLLSLINNLLDFSKIEAGALKIRKSAGSPEEAIRDVYETCQPLLSDKPVAMKVKCEIDVASLITDWQIFRQLALNVVSNAIKFTSRGKIDILLVYDRLRQELKLTVRDTGIGIDPERLNDIFEPFRQLENSYTKKYAGTGLGLAICRKQIEMLGGRIGVTSKPGSWTEFEVLLPCEPYEVPTSQNSAQYSTQNSTPGSD